MSILLWAFSLFRKGNKASASNIKSYHILPVAIAFILNSGIIFAKQAQIVHHLDITRVEIQSKDNRTADFICQDVQWLNQSGEPHIPWKVVSVLLPPDAVLETVEVNLKHAQYESVTGDWDVSPQPPVALLEGNDKRHIWPKGKRIVNGRDVDIYQKDSAWPDMDVKLVHVGQMRKWKLAQIAILLIKHNPVRKNVKKLISGDLELYFDQTNLLFEDSSVRRKQLDRLGKDAVSRIAVNFEQQKESYSQAESDSGYAAMLQGETAAQTEGGPAPGYAIITTSEIQSSSQELSNFVSHKQNKGFSVQVITEADFGGGIGDVAAENIRTWLQNHYVTDNIQYVLLVGNPHPSQGEIPMKMTYPRNNETELPEYKNSPTDFYYADLTGNWDLDGDGYYGEWGHDFGTGGVDRNWEVLVGRIPCYPEPNNPAEQGQVLYDSGPPNRGLYNGEIKYCGFISASPSSVYEQRWSAHPFTISDPNCNITRIDVDYFIPSGDEFDILNYIIWKRTDQQKPELGDEIVQGSIPAPVAYDDPRLQQVDSYLHHIDVDFQLERGDYYFTIYGSRTDGQPCGLGWLGNTEDGMPLLNPSSNPNPGVDAFFWRSAQFPSPGFQEYNLPTSQWASLPGQDPNQLYTAAFTIFGTPVETEPALQIPLSMTESTINVNDLDHILAKIITYENTPQSQAQWRKNVLLPMKSDYAAFQLSYYLGEAIKEQIIDPRADWNCFRIYDEDYSLDPAPELTPCTKNSVTST